MDTYKPVMSFGDDAAENYDELSRRGDEVATVPDPGKEFFRRKRGSLDV